MHSLKSTFNEKSTKYPGVTFTVRNLNAMQRAVRDAQIAAERLEYTRIVTERAMQFKALAGEDGTVEQQNARVNSLPVEKRIALWDMDERAKHIYDGTIVPNAVRFGLVSVDGLDMDGATADADAVLNSAPDDLIEEIYTACVRGSSLTEGEAKN